MKIVIISGTAPPEPIVSGRVHWDMADFLSKNGNIVWLISPKPSRPLGTKYPELKEDNADAIRNDFVHVRINSFVYPKYNLIKRIYESFDFGLKSVRYIKKNIKEVDIIYASPWPFFGQLMILSLIKNKKARLIMNVQDLYPESFFTKINSRTINTLLKPLFRIDKYIANRSDHITVVSNTLKQVYINKRRINESKISVIFNWQDESEFIKPLLSKEQILSKFDLEPLQKKFIFMYLGNIGPVAGVEAIIMAFSKLKSDSSALIIAGSGSQKVKCQSLAKSLNISNSFFLDVPQGLGPVVELQSISDVLLLPIVPGAAHSSIPSKLIAYMFSGKPIITSADCKSETSYAINESGCGWIAQNNDLPEWIRLMNRAKETDKNKLTTMGKSGYEYAMTNYSKKDGLIKVSQLFYRFTK